VQELSELLIHDIRKIFDEMTADRISSAELAGKLVQAEDELWVEFKHGKPISTKQIAELLAPFKIVPNTVRLGTSTFKGYLRKQFKEVFASYTPDSPVTPSQVTESAQNQAKSPVTPEEMLLEKKPENLRSSAGCDGVTAEKGVTGAQGQKTPSQANGHDVCVHCRDGAREGDILILASIPGNNPPVHGRIHKACRQLLSNQHKGGPSA
jgi:hypothetical protein